MEIVHLALEIPTWFANAIAWVDLGQGLSWHSTVEWSLLAQQFEVDVFDRFNAFIANFIESGQAWALLIGIVLGYLIKSVFSYG